MLSLFPAAVALAAGVTFVDDLRGASGSGVVEQAVIGWMERFATEDASAFTTSIRELFDRSNGDLLTAALVVSLWSGSRGIDSIVRSIVLIAGDVERRPWWKRRLLSLGLLLGTVVAGSLAVSMLVVGPLLGGGHAIAAHLGMDEVFTTVWGWARLPLAGAALTGWALVVLHVSRPHAGGWRSDVPGALATAVLWFAASLGLRLWVSVVGSSNAAVGAMGGAVVALLWLYLLALALLAGAEIADHGRRRGWKLPARAGHDSKEAAVAKDHGPSVKDDEQYEALRREGASKEKAARIANASDNSSRSEVASRGGRGGDYEDRTKDELYDKAKQVGIEGRSKMSKDELIDALRHHG